MKTQENKKNSLEKQQELGLSLLKQKILNYSWKYSITDTEDRVNLNLDSVAGNYEHYCRTKLS